MTRPTDDLDLAVDRIREDAAPRDHRTAIAARRLEFRSGPNSHIFYACREHTTLLDTGDVDNFFAVPRHPVFFISPDDGIECDFCREP